MEQLEGQGNGIVQSRKRKALLELATSNAVENYFPSGYEGE